jgi:hypothetical protein
MEFDALASHAALGRGLISAQPLPQRFRCKADIKQFTTLAESMANDPTATSARIFAVMHNSET